MKKIKKELLYLFTFMLIILISLAICNVSKCIKKNIQLKEQQTTIDSLSAIKTNVLIPDFKNYDRTDESIKYRLTNTYKTKSLSTLKDFKYKVGSM